MDQMDFSRDKSEAASGFCRLEKRQGGIRGSDGKLASRAPAADDQGHIPVSVDQKSYLLPEPIGTVLRNPSTVRFYGGYITWQFGSRDDCGWAVWHSLAYLAHTRRCFA